MFGFLSFSPLGCIQNLIKSRSVKTVSGQVLLFFERPPRVAINVGFVIGVWAAVAEH
jgi:hypothetical protein